MGIKFTPDMYNDAIDRLDTLLANEVTATKFDTFEMSWLAEEIGKYEDTYYPLGLPTPEQAAEFRREQETDDDR